MARIIIYHTLFATLDHKEELSALPDAVLRKLIMIPASWLGRSSWHALFNGNRAKIQVVEQTHVAHFSRAALTVVSV